MEAALDFIMAGPAAGARVFTGLNRPRAVGAADARIILIMQRIVWNIEAVDVFPDLN